MTIRQVGAGSKNGNRASSSSSGDLFNGFFTSGRKLDFQKNGIIDARGRGGFGMMAASCAEDVYPYQVPLEARTGPWVQAEGRRMLMLSSYDYLGLVGDPRIEKAAVDAVRRYGSATGGAHPRARPPPAPRPPQRRPWAFPKNPPAPRPPAAQRTTPEGTPAACTSR